MSFVRSQDFVKALESIGISFPKNTSRATIKLDPEDLVRVECVVLVESFVDVTTMTDRAVSMAPSMLSVTKRFRLVEEVEGESLADATARSVLTGLARNS